MEMDEEQQLDWKAMKELVLRRKQVEFPPKLEAFLKENGVVLRPVIVVSSDGSMAQAQITIDLAG
jgi:hypothetical protein